MVRVHESSTAPDQRLAMPAPTQTPAGLLDVAFQASLICLMGGLIWVVFGPEPQTTVENSLQASVVALGLSLSIGVWLAGTQWTRSVKVMGTLAAFTVAILLGWQLIRDFDACAQILKRAQLSQGRIIHRPLGLSYAVPPNYRVNLQPFIVQTSTPESLRGSEVRLRIGDVATLCRMERSSQAADGSPLPASIMLQVLSNSLPHTNALIRSIRQFELQCAASPKVHILRHTHQVWVGRLSTLQFEFFDESKNLTGRHVYLQAGTFTLRFILVGANDADRLQFDTFLNSVRLESPLT